MDSNAKGVPEATPRPWSIDDRRGAPLRNVRILGADERDIAWLSQIHTRDRMLRGRKDHRSGWTTEQANAQDANALADAELIVTAVNSFDALQAQNKLLREALVEIEKGEGPFSLDHKQHAINTIENMQHIARQALQGAK